MPKLGPLALNPGLADQALKDIAEGALLTDVCKSIGCTKGAFYMKAAKDKEFAARYARARKMQAESLAESVVVVARDNPDPAQARVEADARKWLAARLDPMRFADRTGVFGSLQHDINVNAGDAAKDALDAAFGSDGAWSVDGSSGIALPQVIEAQPLDVDAAPQRRKAGRPKGSKNKAVAR